MQTEVNTTHDDDRTPPEIYDQALADVTLRKRKVLDDFMDKPHEIFAGKTPREAMQSLRTKRTAAAKAPDPKPPARTRRDKRRRSRQCRGSRARNYVRAFARALEDKTFDAQTVDDAAPRVSVLLRDATATGAIDALRREQERALSRETKVKAAAGWPSASPRDPGEDRSTVSDAVAAAKLVNVSQPCKVTA